ncbi:hypothetical protein GCM10020331_082990 [Ectobacillus funiculus]
MKDEVKRMANLIGDLLTLARSDSGTLEVRRDSFEFRTHADTIVKSLEPIAAAKKISVFNFMRFLISIYMQTWKKIEAVALHFVG